MSTAAAGVSPDARRYVTAMLFSVAVLLAIIPAANIVMDPLGYARAAGWRPAFPNEAEASFAAGGAWPVPDGTREAKILNVAYYRPQSLVFGSSTVWSHIDAGYSPLRGPDGRAAFNFGLAGVSMRELLGAFEHAASLQSARRAVVGLEFYMFAGDKPTSPGYFDLPMAQRDGYRGDLRRYVTQRLFTADYAKASQAALWEPAVKRVASLWGGANRVRLTAPNYGIGVGGGPRYSDGPPHGGAATREAFEQRMLDGDRVLLAGLYPPAGTPFRFVDDSGWSSLEAVRRLVRVARERGIELSLYLSPHHARAYEAIRLMGWWPQYEAWQLALTGIVEDDARSAGRPPVAVWDFGGYSAITMDPLEAFPDGTFGYRRYADAIHFSTEVGYLCLDRVLGVTPSADLPEDFGVPITRQSLTEHQAHVRAAQERYTEAHAADTAALAAMLIATGRMAGPP